MLCAMSYTSINGMRSARYPLQGCGCGRALGQEEVARSWVGTIVGFAAVAGIATYALTSRPMRKNRRYHRRRR